jgi:SAM-dependent methyltransferase
LEIRNLKSLVTNIRLKAGFGYERRYCPVCSQQVKNFLPLPEFFLDNLRKDGWKYKFEESEFCNVKNYLCPACGASDRDRLYALYLKEYLPMTRRENAIRIVDFAPSPQLTAFIKNLGTALNQNIAYRTADLLMQDVDDKIDIMNMTIYPDPHFDFFICSHMLEHVVDDRKALRELYRILKWGGQGILVVPIVLTIDEIDEDPSVTDVAERWRRFGQDDHLRLYSKQGFLRRVEETGFVVHQLGRKFFGEKVFMQNGITPQSVLYIVEKTEHSELP